jgi:hypothetical protein
MRLVGKMAIFKHKYGTVAIEGYLQFERVVFCVKNLFPFPLATAKLIGNALKFFDHLTESIRFAYSRRDKPMVGIGGNNTSPPIGKADQIYRMNRILQQLRLCGFFGGFTGHNLFKK